MPFRGAPCSDAAGRERCYGELYNQLVVQQNTTTGRQYDDLLQSPWFNYVDAQGTVHQVWYDDPQSLSVKFAMAKSLGLGGVGVWNFDCLDTTSTDPHTQQAMAAMWAAFETFLQD